MLNKKRPRTVGLLSNEIMYLKVLCKHYFIFIFGSASFLLSFLYVLFYIIWPYVEFLFYSLHRSLTSFSSYLSAIRIISNCIISILLLEFSLFFESPFVSETSIGGNFSEIWFSFICSWKSLIYISWASVICSEYVWCHIYIRLLIRCSWTSKSL